MTGKWVTFEGIGGSGKGTQVELIYNWLIEKRIPVIQTLEPGGTDFGHEVRKIVKQPRNPKLSPFTELMLFQADRNETVEQVIKLNLKKNMVIISDRGPFGTIAYQGFGRGISLNLIDSLTKEATSGIKPDFTFLLDIEPEIALNRISQRKDREIDQFDLEKIEFQKKVREGFLYAAKNNNSKMVFILNANNTKEEIHNQIINLFEKHIIH